MSDTNKSVGTAAAVTLVMAMTGAMPVAQANPYECLIEPNQVVEVRSQAEGVIQNLYVRRGDRVQAGQVLVQLESSAEQSAVETARYRAQMQGRVEASQSRLNYALKKSSRSRDLQQQKFISDQSADEAHAERQIAAADVVDATETKELAKREHQHALNQLNRRTIRSPFNGVVVDRMLNVGDLAESGNGRKPILKLAQVEPLRVEVVMPLSAWGKVRVGTKGEVSPEGLGGKYTATVSIVDSVFDSASGTFGVRLELSNPKGALPAGIRCKVAFAGLPASAVPVAHQRR